MCEREKGGGNERDEKDAGKDLRSRVVWGKWNFFWCIFGRF